MIVVVVGEQAEEQFAITGSAIESYADRCGADFRIVRGDRFDGQRWPMGNKWRIGPYVAAYDRTLYVDVDVVIQRTAPDIFATVPEHRIALYDEYAETIGNVAGNWIQRDSDIISDMMGWESSARTWAANGGVMLFPRWAAALYRPPSAPFPRMWCLDQGLLTQQLDRHHIVPYLLDRRWNHGFVGENFFAGIPDAFFVHLNGSRPHSYRMRLLKRIVAGNYARLDPPRGSHWKPQWAR